jgi:sulfonate transport system substrate-binding protein
VMLPPADARAAFTTGAIDAWATWDPYVATAQLNDQARILTTSQGLSPRLGLIDASSSAIADKGKHAAVQDLLNRLAKAYTWSATHVKQWAAAYSTLYSTPLPVAELVEGRGATRFVPVEKSVVGSLQSVADLYGRYGVIKPTTVSSAFDHSFSVPSTGV